MCGCNGGNRSNALGMGFLNKGNNMPRKPVPLPLTVNTNNALAKAINRSRNTAAIRKRPTMGMFIR